jgi:hypothetical protein
MENLAIMDWPPDGILLDWHQLTIEAASRLAVRITNRLPGVCSREVVRAGIRGQHLVGTVRDSVADQRVTPERSGEVDMNNETRNHNGDRTTDVRLLGDQTLNKGSAFAKEERKQVGLRMKHIILSATAGFVLSAIVRAQDPGTRVVRADSDAANSSIRRANSPTIASNGSNNATNESNDPTTPKRQHSRRRLSRACRGSMNAR